MALAVIEVSGHSDHGFGHFFAEVVLSGFLHFAQHFCGDLRGRELRAIDFHPSITVVGLGNGVGHEIDVFLDFFLFKAAANQALDRIQRVLRVGDGLILRRRTHANLAIFHVSNDGRRGARAFSVFNHLGRVALHDGHARVGRAQVDSDDSSHVVSPVMSKMCWM